MKITILALSLILAGQLLGETIPPINNEFQILKDRKEKAVQNALQPINTTYKNELKKLYDQAMQSKNLELATKIDAEIKDLETAEKQRSPIDPEAKKRAFERKLINTKWFYPKSDKPKANQFIEFKANGLLIVGWAATQGIFHWTITEDENTILIRPWNDQNSFQSMVIDPGFKKAFLKEAKGDVEINVLK